MNVHPEGGHGSMQVFWGTATESAVSFMDIYINLGLGHRGLRLGHKYRAL